MNDLTLDPRLSLAASFVRDGAHLVDVGTDHAYLPIKLLLSGRIIAATATDINEGPLSTARENAAKYSVSDSLSLQLADGLVGVTIPHDKCDIAICGMGGELIASIIEKSKAAKKSGVNLILQPMSKADSLRSYLSNGFETLDESICESGGKLYQCILCRYTEETKKLSPASLVLGEINIKKRNENPLFARLLAQYIKRYEKELHGRQSGRLDTSAEEAFLAEAHLIEKEMKNDSI